MKKVLLFILTAIFAFGTYTFAYTQEQIGQIVTQYEQQMINKGKSDKFIFKTFYNLLQKTRNLTRNKPNNETILFLHMEIYKIVERYENILDEARLSQAELLTYIYQDYDETNYKSLINKLQKDYGIDIFFDNKTNLFKSSNLKYKLLSNNEKNKIKILNTIVEALSVYNKKLLRNYVNKINVLESLSIDGTNYESTNNSSEKIIYLNGISENLDKILHQEIANLVINLDNQSDSFVKQQQTNFVNSNTKGFEYGKTSFSNLSETQLYEKGFINEQSTNSLKQDIASIMGAYMESNSGKPKTFIDYDIINKKLEILLGYYYEIGLTKDDTQDTKEYIYDTRYSEDEELEEQNDIKDEEEYKQQYAIEQNNEEISNQNNDNQQTQENNSSQDNEIDEGYSNLYNYGVKLYNEGDIDGALEIFHNAVTYKDTAELSFMIGLCYYDKELYQSALPYLQHASALDQSNTKYQDYYAKTANYLNNN